MDSIYFNKRNLYYSTTNQIDSILMLLNFEILIADAVTSYD
jgi:hypothetical protein